MLTITLRKRLFVKQYAKNDCGPSCLSMILNYTGKKELSMEVLKMKIPSGGWTISELKRSAEEFGLKPRAVEMNTETLKSLGRPCVLHCTKSEGEGHFIVCFAYSKKGFLIADPALQMAYTNENDLENIWLSRAAVCFENMPPKPVGHTTPSWMILFEFSSISFSILLCICLSTFLTAASGIALTWYLQKAASSEGLMEPKLIAIIALLLTGIGLFRTLTNFIRQRLMTRFNLRFNSRLMNLYLDKLSDGNKRKSYRMVSVKAMFSNIQQMQNAASAFVATVVAEAVMIASMLIAIASLIPVAAMIVLSYLMFTAYAVWTEVNHNTISFIKTNQMSGELERRLVSNAQCADLGDTELDDLKRQHHDILKSANNIAFKSGKFIWICETMGILCLTIVVLISIASYLNGQIPFSNLFATAILTYIIMNLIPKVIAAVEVVNAGADAAVQFKRYIDL